MLDRPRSGERALLLHIGLNRPCFDDETQEFRALAESAGARVVGEIQARRERPDPKYFVGSGKVDEIAARARETQAELILVNQPLRAGQERNLELTLKTRVLDRNGLILDIFAQRAATFEGKLQVELAQHEHLASRLVRGWTHLERQKGGIGLRGPGETQLETDRRLVSRRIRHLRERLERVERQREVSRKERQRADVPTVALVGYTNAGKTTLFNALAGANLVAKDQLFATLDPTVRRLSLGGGAEALLVDTVGFVRDLPHELVAAFRATLTETREATLAAARHRRQRSASRGPPAAGRERARGDRRCRGSVPCGCTIRSIGRHPTSFGNSTAPRSPSTVSPPSPERALPALKDAIRARVAGARVAGELRLRPEQSRLRARLFDWHAVRGETVEEDGGYTLDVDLPAQRWRQLRDEEGLSADSIRQKV